MRVVVVVPSPDGPEVTIGHEADIIEALVREGGDLLITEETVGGATVGWAIYAPGRWERARQVGAPSAQVVAAVVAREAEARRGAGR